MAYQRKQATLPPHLAQLLTETGLNPEMDKGDVWNCHGTPVILHRALEKIATAKNIIFDAPQIIEAQTGAKIAVVCVNGRMDDVSAWSIGEATPYNNKNEYPWAMAEKRAKDRVILKLIGASGHVYSEEEADDFKAANPNGPNQVAQSNTEESNANYDPLEQKAKDFMRDCAVKVQNMKTVSDWKNHWMSGWVQEKMTEFSKTKSYPHIYEMYQSSGKKFGAIQ